MDRNLLAGFLLLAVNICGTLSVRNASADAPMVAYEIVNISHSYAKKSDLTDVSTTAVTTTPENVTSSQVSTFSVTVTTLSVNNETFIDSNATFSGENGGGSSKSLVLGLCLGFALMVTLVVGTWLGYNRYQAYKGRADHGMGMRNQDGYTRQEF